MSCKAFAVLLMVCLGSTAALAQGSSGSGGGGGGGSAGGAPGSAPSGTAGVSSSTTNPGVGTPGVPGPSSGAGLPGGPGPSNTAIAPQTPGLPSTSPSVGKGQINGNGGASNFSSAGGAQTGAQGARVQTAGTSNFNPGAVTDQSLERATQDISAMPADEVRAFARMLHACTVKGHPADRSGKCASASRDYKRRFGKNRMVDQSILELERIVRFQKMFKGTQFETTEYGDRINQRLIRMADLAMASPI